MLSIYASTTNKSEESLQFSGNITLQLKIESCYQKETIAVHEIDQELLKFRLTILLHLIYMILVKIYFVKINFCLYETVKII